MSVVAAYVDECTCTQAQDFRLHDHPHLTQVLLPLGLRHADGNRSAVDYQPLVPSAMAVRLAGLLVRLKISEV